VLADLGLAESALTSFQLTNLGFNTIQTGDSKSTDPDRSRSLTPSPTQPSAKSFR
jgi:hypothetical protein